MATQYYCQECGYGSIKWIGRCPSCNKWNTIVEEVVTEAPLTHRGFYDLPQEPVLLPTIELKDNVRINTGLSEFNAVLGGGLTEGSLVLIGGDPGIGKSTLLLQVCDKISKSYGQVLYVSGEESAVQVKLRADRLNINGKGLYILSETNIESIIHQIPARNPAVVIIDSIQTVYKSELNSCPGSVGQIRECTHALMYLAKRTGIPIVIIGHVTKEGAIAGPRVLEHIVDTVLYFEGDQQHTYRILRAVKNRFGSTNELGIFEMVDAGLKEILNPSATFLCERPLNTPGSVVTASMEGTRVILVEIQSLVSPTNFGFPRRETIGVDDNRTTLLVAVLEKKIGLHLGSSDLFVNTVGGLKVSEPAADLAIAISITLSLKDKSLDPQTVIFGEVGLAGEVRAIGFVQKRIDEIKKLGFNRCILPQTNLNNLHKEVGLNLIGVKTLSEALEAI